MLLCIYLPQVCVDAFKINHTRPKTSSCATTHSPSSSIKKSFFHQQRANGNGGTELQLDVFGLGPSEFLLVVGVGLALFGPDTIKDKFMKRNTDDDDSKPFKWAQEGTNMAEVLEKRQEMQEFAEQRRKDRALKRLFAAVDENNSFVIDKMEEFELLQEAKREIELEQLQKQYKNVVKEDDDTDNDDFDDDSDNYDDDDDDNSSEEAEKITHKINEGGGKDSTSDIIATKLDAAKLV